MAPLPCSDTRLLLPYSHVLFQASTWSRCPPQPVPRLGHTPSPPFNWPRFLFSQNFTCINTLAISSQLFFLFTWPMKIGQSVPKCQHIKFRQKEFNWIHCYTLRQQSLLPNSCCKYSLVYANVPCHEDVWGRRGMGLNLHPDEGSVSFIYQLFINGEEAATAHYIGGWVGVCQELNRNHLVIQPLGQSIQWLSYSSPLIIVYPIGVGM